MLTMMKNILSISPLAPGVYPPENDQGKEGRVTTRRLDASARKPSRRSPASPWRRGRDASRESRGKRRGGAPFRVGAGDLIEHGAPAAAALQASVTGLYSAECCGSLHHNLPANEHPSPLTALFKARRTVERLRCVKHDPLEKIALTGWAVSMLYLRGKPTPLYDPKEVHEKI